VPSLAAWAGLGP